MRRASYRAGTRQLRGVKKANRTNRLPIGRGRAQNGMDRIKQKSKAVAAEERADLKMITKSKALRRNREARNK
jgi:hypothetical protein